MSEQPRLVPLDGSINVLPGFIDFHAEYNSSKPWAKFLSTEHSGKVMSVTYAEYARATHRTAHILRPRREGEDGETVGILIHCDTLLYLALLPGLIRAGFIPFPMSPRNSPEAVVHMLEQANCHRLVGSSFSAPLVTAVQKLLDGRNYDLRVDLLPPLRSVFPGLYDPNASLDIIPYPSSTKVSKPDDVVFILHSSGSTGPPKLVPQTNRTTLQCCMNPVVYKYRGMGVGQGVAMLPTFHIMGMFIQFYQPLTTGEFIALYPPQEPAPPIVPNPQNYLEVIESCGCSAATAVPAFLEIWAQSAEAIKVLAKLKAVTFAGGPLSDPTGDLLTAAGVRLFSIYGATEIGAVTGFLDTDDTQGPDSDVKTSADWAWLTFGDLFNCRWIDQGDGSYELQFLTCETHQPAIENLPDERGYATSDLFKPHPKKKGLWKIVGRLDDVIILGTGEKVVPIPQEGLLTSLPFVSGAVMFGRGKNFTGVLVELRPENAFDSKDEDALVEFRNKIWPYVQEANKLGPTFGRIFKEMIIVTDPAKPMDRSAKGTIQRKAILTAYASEIARLYETVEKSRNARDLDSWRAQDIEKWLSQNAASISNGLQPQPDIDLFAQGFDSLSATFLRNRIIGALQSSPEPGAVKAAKEISSEFVFTHPTIQRLAAAIAALVDPSTKVVHGTARIGELIDRYSANLPEAPTTYESPSSDVVVVLTGSTGALGAHVLASLLEEPSVTRVYTINRGDQVLERQRDAFIDKSLPVRLLDSNKLLQLSADLAQDSLGLDPKVLAEIKSTATHFIHNAWKVDFNFSLSSFESQIAIARRLIDISVGFSQQVKFLFTSSIAIATGWDTSNGPVPESIIENEECLSKYGRGYESSKYVVEHILAKVRSSGALQATILRVGQISGSTTTGTWNPIEWIPGIVKSSITLGSLPALEGVVSWIPMDITARTIVDVVLSKTLLPEVVNIVHPRPVTWNSVFSSLRHELSDHYPALSLVPFDIWLEKVEAAASNATGKDLENIPSLKILRFLKNLSVRPSSSRDEAGVLPSFSTTIIQEVSASLRNAPQLDDKQAALWLAYWRKKNLL